MHYTFAVTLVVLGLATLLSGAEGLNLRTGSAIKAADNVNAPRQVINDEEQENDTFEGDNESDDEDDDDEKLGSNLLELSEGTRGSWKWYTCLIHEEERFQRLKKVNGYLKLTNDLRPERIKTYEYFTDMVKKGYKWKTVELDNPRKWEESGVNIRKTSEAISIPGAHPRSVSSNVSSSATSSLQSQNEEHQRMEGIQMDQSNRKDHLNAPKAPLPQKPVGGATRSTTNPLTTTTTSATATISTATETTTTSISSQVNETQNTSNLRASFSELDLSNLDSLSPAVKSSIIGDGKKLVETFLTSHSIYEILPMSAQVVVLDVDIPIKLAMFALIEHDLYAAPLWDPVKNNFAGMLTVTDYLEITRYLYQNEAFALAFSSGNASIRAWRDLARKAGGDFPENLIYVDPEDSLHHACSLLRKYSLHRLPVISINKASGGAVLAVVTYQSILRFLVTHFREVHPLFSMCIYSLGIGTYENIFTVSAETPLIEVINVLSRNKISAVPVLDPEDGRVIDVYDRNNVINLARDNQMSSLILPVSHALGIIRKRKLQRMLAGDEGERLSASHHRGGRSINTKRKGASSSLSGSISSSHPSSSAALQRGENFSGDSSNINDNHHSNNNLNGSSPFSFSALNARGIEVDGTQLFTCTKNDNIHDLFVKFSMAETNRLVCVDEKMQCKGIVTLSSLLDFFVDTTRGNTNDSDIIGGNSMITEDSIGISQQGTNTKVHHTDDGRKYYDAW
eukprot:g3295.t1